MSTVHGLFSGYCDAIWMITCFAVGDEVKLLLCLLVVVVIVLIFKCDICIILYVK